MLLSALFMCPALRRVEIADNIVDADELAGMTSALAARRVTVVC